MQDSLCVTARITFPGLRERSLPVSNVAAVMSVARKYNNRCHSPSVSYDTFFPSFPISLESGGMEIAEETFAIYITEKYRRGREIKGRAYG